ncbi:hypothetical protein UFOVP421_33 [uncultured Caudovirales phage]|uniref:Uncharacterized protein n=1 Tax=uncultured Caudovirales phage TaxID=2100421 RepID=A0A6J5MDV8_9CAUD|nr:hypothetical protein UFOVP421_33 [uncultured Caudovirales phage]
MTSRETSTLGGVGDSLSAVSRSGWPPHAPGPAKASRRRSWRFSFLPAQSPQTLNDGEDRYGSQTRCARSNAPAIDCPRTGLPGGRGGIHAKVPLAHAVRVLRDARRYAGPCVPRLPRRHAGPLAARCSQGFGAGIEYGPSLPGVQQRCRLQSLHQHPGQAGLHPRETSEAAGCRPAHARLGRGRDCRVEPQHADACAPRATRPGTSVHAVQLAVYPNLGVAANDNTPPPPGWPNGSNRR